MRKALRLRDPRYGDPYALARRKLRRLQWACQQRDPKHRMEVLAGHLLWLVERALACDCAEGEERKEDTPET